MIQQVLLLLSVYGDHKAISSDQLTVRKGDIVGLVDKSSSDAFWKVRVLCKNHFPG